MINIEVYEKCCKIIKGAILEMEQSTYEYEVDDPLSDLEDEISKALYDLHNAEYDLRSSLSVYKEAVEMGDH